MRKHKMLRVAAATSVSVVVTVAALGPVHASSDSEAATATTTQGAVASEGARAADPVGPDHTDGNASTEGDVDGPQPESNADQNDGGANSYDCEEGPEGPYCGTDRTEESQNGMGHGEATGRPGAGTVGKADNKNPQGQEPGPSDGNRGYECDQPGDEPNQGIAEGNPAHTGCTEATAPEEEIPGGETPDEEIPDGETPDEEIPGETGHTAVTVCHLLGNGGYIELTFDDNALEAHLDHGDVYPVPGDGCASGETPGGETPGGETPGGETPGGETPGGETPGGETPGGETPGQEKPTDDVVVDDSEEEVAGEQESDEVAGEQESADDDDVLGVDGAGGAEADEAQGVNRAPTDVAPATASTTPNSGILPATGAGEYAPLLLGGAALVAAGVLLLARRRLQDSR